MPLISVDEKKCTQCNACAESCPVALYTVTKEKSYPSIPKPNESRCIYCGHCESVCPTGALTHQLSEKALASVHDTVRTPGPEEMSVYFKNRRSIRQFKSKTIDRQTIEQVMDVVRYAPTGSNRQLTQWIVVSNPELIHQIAKSTIEWMKNLLTTNPELAARLGANRLIFAFEKGYDGICRKAPHLFISYAPSSHPGGIKDAVIAASHLELILPGFGLGGCWAGYLMLALQQWPHAKSLIGLDEAFSVHAVLMGGYPKYKYKTIPPRNAPIINWL